MGFLRGFVGGFEQFEFLVYWGVCGGAARRIKVANSDRESKVFVVKPRHLTDPALWLSLAVAMRIAIRSSSIQTFGCLLDV